MEQIQWFPGHMKKAERLIEKNLKNVDIIIEILDARIPKSSSNPIIENLGKTKKTIKILNKSDLADCSATADWIYYYKTKNMLAVPINSKAKEGIKELLSAIEQEKDKIYSLKKYKNQTARCMVLGVPNSGKSTLINAVAGLKKAKVENRPGVTKDIMWIKVNPKLELMDMPGITWNKFLDETTGYMLATTGAIKEDVLDIEYVAVALIEFLRYKYYKNMNKLYGLSLQQDTKTYLQPSRETIEKNASYNYKILEEIAIKRGYLEKGGLPDTLRAAKSLLHDFRNGKLGRITLERI